ncbi:MAG: DUF7563 family protein [Natronomonas sp.]
MLQNRNATSSGRRCKRCRTVVTPKFIRIFGSDGEVHGCPECMTSEQLFNGKAAVSRTE